MAPIRYFLCVGLLFCGVALGVPSSLTTVLLRKRKLVALSKLRRGSLYFSLFLVVMLVGLHYLVEASHGHTHFAIDR